MNTLIAVSIAPVGVGDELAAHVGEVVRVIRESGLPSKTTAMFTELEGDWDEVMSVVKRATMVLAERGIRTEVLIKADIRPGFENMMEGKLARLDAAMNSDDHSEQLDRSDQLERSERSEQSDGRSDQSEGRSDLSDDRSDGRSDRSDGE